MSVLTRGDSVLSTHSAGPRLFTKQGTYYTIIYCCYRFVENCNLLSKLHKGYIVCLDSAASSVSWRLSPSSSGYKSQSQRSESVTPSPTSTPYPQSEYIRQDSCSETTEQTRTDRHNTQLVWAVTDIHSVPKGSVIINPKVK